MHAIHAGDEFDGAAAHEFHSSLEARSDGFALPNERVPRRVLQAQLATVPLQVARNVHE
jgi:hypothetical protein